MYTHSIIDDSGIVVDHFRGRPTLSMEECRTQGPLAIQGSAKIAEPMRYRFEPERDPRRNGTVYDPKEGARRGLT